MTSAGKWVLGLLLLVVGAVFVARTVSSDPGSQATVELPAAESAGAAKDTEEEKAKAAAEAAAKKVAGTVAGDVACKKACIEVNEVANDAVTTAKLAPGSVTLSKLAFEVPNLNELENEINARKATEAALKAANAEAAAAGAKNDAAITAAASNGITAEAAARAAADEALSKNVAAADATLLGNINKEIADRSAADDVLQGKLNTEIADRAGALSTLRGELANPNSVGAPILAINNNEIVGGAVQSNSILDRTIIATDLAVGAVTTTEILNRTILTEDLSGAAVVGRAAGETPATTNVKVQSLRGQREANTLLGTAVSAGDLAVGTITGERTPLGGIAVGNIALGTIGTDNIADGQITLAKLAGDTVALLDDLRADLEQEIDDREADVDQEEADRLADVDAEESARKADVDAEESARKADVDAEESARIAADTTLTNNLATEVTNRTNGDAALQTALTAEIAARALADTTLQTNLNTEIANRAAAITAEVAARNAAITSAVDAHKLELITPVGPGDDKLVHVDNIQGLDADAAKGKAKDLACSVASTPCVQDDEIESVSGSKVDGAVAEADLATDLDCATCVSNDELAGNIDFAKLDGTTIIIDASMLAAGFEISGGQITDGTVEAADLAGEYDTDPAETEITVGAVTSEKIADGTILSRDVKDGAVELVDLAPNSVNSSKIQDGQVTAADLAAGAVTTDKMTANALSSISGSSLAVGQTAVSLPLGGSTLTLGSLNHKVMLSGQGVVTCATCTALAQQQFRWQLFDGTTAVGPEYSKTLIDATPFFISFSSLAGPTTTTAVPSGAHTYTVKITTPAAATQALTLSDVVVNAVDLGVAPSSEVPPTP